MRQVVKWATFLVFAFLLMFYPAIPARADFVQPTSTPTLPHIYVDRNLLETGDVLFLAEYSIPYTTNASFTSTSVDLAFTFQLIYTANSTVAGQVLAYPYQNYGYSVGAISFYFPASTNLTWGAYYTIRILENPTVFTSNAGWFDIAIPAGDYTSETTTAGNQANLKGQVLTLADLLSTAWGTSYQLTTTSNTGQVLSGQGEVYFRDHAIPGLTSMAPALFNVQYHSPTATTRSWTTGQATIYETRFNGTWVATALSGVASLFNISVNLVGVTIVIIACIAVMVLSSQSKKKGQDTSSGWSGVMACLSVLYCGALLGWAPMTLIGVIQFIVTFYIGMLLIPLVVRG